MVLAARSPFLTHGAFLACICYMGDVEQSATGRLVPTVKGRSVFDYILNILQYSHMWPIVCGIPYTIPSLLITRIAQYRTLYA